jgi:hypothetical protein
MNTDAHIQVERIGTQRPHLHIAVVTETYPPDINGVAHTLSKMVEGLQLKGHAPVQTKSPVLTLSHRNQQPLQQKQLKTKVLSPLKVLFMLTC